jgi:hypothetical protein
MEPGGSLPCSQHVENEIADCQQRVALKFRSGARISRKIIMYAELAVAVDWTEFCARPKRCFKLG